MTLYVHVTPKGHQVYRLVNGRYTLDIGPAWPTSREACRYADALEAAEGISPLRLSAEGSDANTGPSLPVGVEPSAEVRARASRRRGTRRP